MPDRLTIDANVIRDYQEPDRLGYDDAVALFDLRRRGEVEIVTAPQGYRSDVEAGTPLAESFQETFANERVGLATQLAYPSPVTFLPLILGHAVGGFSEAWDQIAATWRTHEGSLPEEADRWYVETHIADGRDVFLTNDRALVAMCRRLRDEHHLRIEAMTVAEYLKRRSTLGI